MIFNKMKFYLKVIQKMFIPLNKEMFHKLIKLEILLR